MFPSPPSPDTTGRMAPDLAAPLDSALCKIPERLQAPGLPFHLPTQLFNQGPLARLLPKRV
jgi:hypothetical protein